MIRSLFIRSLAILVVFLPITMAVGAFSEAVRPKKPEILHIYLTFGVPPSARTVSVLPTVQPANRSYDGGTSILGGPSLSGSFINGVLAAAGSPAAGTGQALSDLSTEYHIDDAYALSVFEKESSFGRFGAAFSDHSLGNINCAGYPTCDSRFRSYASWQVGYEDFYRLIAYEYLPRGLDTVEKIIRVYAPSSENDTNLYISQVCASMSAFRRQASV